MNKLTKFLLELLICLLIFLAATGLVIFLYQLLFVGNGISLSQLIVH